MNIALPLATPTTDNNLFDMHVRHELGTDLTGLSLQTVQANIGLRCNQACHHCHVESSPSRQEEMSWETMQLVLHAARRAGTRTLDITGGAPEMHPRFRHFVDAAVKQGLNVIVRTNLTILLEPGYDDLPRYFADRHVHLVASLPCYLEENVDRQRGRNVFCHSIEAIRRLNAVGYGLRTRLPLDLIYNPDGPSLPPAQHKLEDAYKAQLFTRFALHFTRLYTITNMPIGRFLHELVRDGKDQQYMEVLKNAFNPTTLDGLMCRHQLHVGWDGAVYDCDFNFALGLPANGPAQHIRDFDPQTFLHRLVATGEHCFGCTAGHGSSCTGSLA